MGLDIFLGVNNQDEFDSGEHACIGNDGLSRSFCNFICRQEMLEGETELNQLSKLTGVDVGPIYELHYYPTDEDVDYRLAAASDEQERQTIRQTAEADRAKMAGNITRVFATVEGLLSQLSALDDLPLLLNSHQYNSPYNTAYFSNFTMDMGDGYIGNNFGQDLRNFKRFLDYAKTTGSTTVFFAFG